MTLGSNICNDFAFPVLWVLACAVALFVSTSDSSAAERKLGLALADLPARSYDVAVATARDIGVSFSSIPLHWDEIETAPGVYALEIDWLAIAASTYPQLGLNLALEVNLIDTHRDRRPQWLQNKPWDDPEVIAAFQLLVRHIVTQSSGLELVSLSLGNEVDGLLADDATQWRAYSRLAAAGRAAALAVRPELLSGVKMTFAGATGPSKAAAVALSASQDVVLLTYYPLHADFRARSSHSPIGDFELITTVFPNHPIHLAEIGYPSSASCAGGESGQAAFVTTVFDAWDAHRDKIAAINWTWMTDISASEVSAAGAYYGVNKPCFLEYLATLGLERNDLQPKASWEVFAREARSRFVD